PNEHALRILRADPGDEGERDDERAENRAQVIGGVYATYGLPGVLARSCERGDGQGEARAPQDGGRQDGPQTPHHIELEGVPGAEREQRIDGPVREGSGDDPEIGRASCRERV